MDISGWWPDGSFLGCFCIPPSCKVRFSSENLPPSCFFSEIFFSKLLEQIVRLDFPLNIFLRLVRTDSSNKRDSFVPVLQMGKI